MFEVEAKASRPTPKFWPRGLNITGYTRKQNFAASGE